MLTEAISIYKEIIKNSGVSQERINDLANAICMCDMLYGDNNKKLSYDRLVYTTKDLFTPAPAYDVVLSSNNLSELPRVQVLRVLCDIVRIISKTEDHKKYTVVGAFSPSSLMITGGRTHHTAESSYASEQQCIEYLRLMRVGADLARFSVLGDLILSIQKSADNYYGLLNKKSQAHELRDLVLPISIQYGLRGYTTDTMRFISDKDFVSYLQKNNYTVETYCNCIKAYAYTTTAQNVLLRLETLSRTNMVMFCTVCRGLIKVLKQNGEMSICCNTNHKFGIIADGNCMKVKLFKEYIEKIFKSTGVVTDEGLDIQTEMARQFVDTVKRWCRE